MADEHRAANRRLWDAWARVHRRSAYYDVEGFRAGRSSLRSVELAEVGDVSGLALLHLQCHFGLDTLSWARRGARVTGVDFSGAAIRAAHELAEEAGLDARFIQADVYELPDRLDERFDLVFASYGVLWWLEDLPRWAEVIAGLLKPGGTFYLVEFHPLLNALNDDGRSVEHDYFARGPFVEDKAGTYAEPDDPVRGIAHGWPHGLAEVVCAILGAGLRLEFLHEFGASPWRSPPLVERAPEGGWTLPGHRGRLPVLFSLRARKDGRRAPRERRPPLR